MNIYVTSITASIFGFVLTGLIFSIIQIRRDEHISLGDGGNKVLERRIRGHGNFIETVPISLFLLFLMEQSFSQQYVAILAAILIISRVSHAYTFACHDSEAPPFYRIGGMVGTVFVIVTCSFSLLYINL
jgi:uncharacterized membrane protein YecN with MAPEG domain